MARYDHLPVYKTSYDLLLFVFQITKDMNREYKYTLGQEIKKETVEMISYIYRANSRMDKKDLIGKSIENIEVIKLYFRLLKDLKQINLKKMVYITEKIESISKQLNAWQRAFT
ncbi:four helix bundle protein [Candidatus Parcubacteria bacterium]|nr:MAG: four helix bundle protein [Candidatus Parcubacteria bacterium]